jgi:hypothetical protein
MPPSQLVLARCWCSRRGSLVDPYRIDDLPVGYFMMKRHMLTALTFAALSFAAVPAGATNLLGSTSSATISGTTFGFGPSSMPWTAEVYAGAGVCLRIAVIAQATDLETVVIAPNGTVYRDDDGGVGTLPLVAINGTPNNGWYSVRINNFSGAAVSANFTATLQRLPLNGAGCLPATTPQLAAAPAAAKANGLTARPAAGQAGF